MVVLTAAMLTLTVAAPSPAADDSADITAYDVPPAPLAPDEELDAPGAETNTDEWVSPAMSGVSGYELQTLTVPGTKGSEYWLTFTRSGLAIRTRSNYRWSWSWMWYMKPRLDSQQAFVTGACTVLRIPGKAKSACVLAANLFYIHMKNLINDGLATRRCLQYKVPLTPYPNVMIRDIRFYLVKCRH